MKQFITNLSTLTEIFNLIEQGYHFAYGEDCGDYYTILITNDNGEMKDEDIDDVYFDFDHLPTISNIKNKNKTKEITNEQIKLLKDGYESNREDLINLKKYVKDYGSTDCGLTDVSESFEQGYNNALEMVFDILEI